MVEPRKLTSDEVYGVLRATLVRAEAYRTDILTIVNGVEQQIAEGERSRAMYVEALEQLDRVLLSCHELLSELDRLTA
jgi:hypothetical protein